MGKCWLGIPSKPYWRRYNMAWPTPLWTVGGVKFYVINDTGWGGSSGDAELHVLDADETTIHDVGRESLRRAWQGLARTQATMNSLKSLIGTNVAYDTPFDSGNCRVMDVKGRSVYDSQEPSVAKYNATVEMVQR